MYKKRSFSGAKQLSAVLNAHVVDFTNAMQCALCAWDTYRSDNFERTFWYPRILPKNKWTNSFLLLKRIRSFVFWENSRISKSTFEIIWPLVAKRWNKFFAQLIKPPKSRHKSDAVQWNLVINSKNAKFKTTCISKVHGGAKKNFFKTCKNNMS